MTARFVVGDVLEVLATLESGSVDLVMSSPPFLALRSYLPADHPDKGREIGQESTPGEFLDVLLDVVEECGRVLAPHGSLVFELGDTYAGSGGAGGDYNEGGLRPDQPKFSGSALSYRKSAQRNRAGGGARKPGDFPDRPGPDERDNVDGWPLDKSKVLIPQLFAVALSYGFNPLTGRRTEPWRVRNTVAWCRPNPPVGRDGDKFRPGTSFLTVATKARDRYWDGDAVRRVNNPDRMGERGWITPKHRDNEQSGSKWSGGDARQNPAGAPLLDWWELATSPYAGSHYATYPPELVVPVVKSMGPAKVCRECGRPSRRITEARYVDADGDPVEAKSWPSGTAGGMGAHSLKDAPRSSAVPATLGWSCCGCSGCYGGVGAADPRYRTCTVDHWRAGVVLDPFAGSGTTLAVATGHGLDAIGIDIDERNAELALERVGPLLLTVEQLKGETAA